MGSFYAFPVAHKAIGINKKLMSNLRGKKTVGELASLESRGGKTIFRANAPQFR